MKRYLVLWLYDGNEWDFEVFPSWLEALVWLAKGSRPLIAPYDSMVEALEVGGMIDEMNGVVVVRLKDAE